jgi:signal transduction histidine kinase
MIYLVSLTQRPTRAIIDDLKAGRPPRYQGIAEFEFLAQSIAGMMQELMEKTLALERYRDSLEQRVEERTSELTQANDKLQDLIHELENSQQQLLQSEKLAAIGQLAAGVAHEINNPIGFVNSNLGVLGKYVQGLIRVIDAYERQPAGAEGGDIEAIKQEVDYEFLKEDFAQLFDESVSGLARIKKIVVDLRDFSRLGDREWKQADLNQGLDSTLNIVANELKYKAKVIKDYGELPEIECLPGELNQVFLNLLVNAGHAIRDNGEIVIRTRCAEAEVIVEISDNGCGIPAAALPRIFEPFFTTKPVGQGTGLGLALSYGIALKHHGRFEVDSTVGQGTSFRLHLPVAQPKTAPVNGRS